MVRADHKNKLSVNMESSKRMFVFAFFFTIWCVYNLLRIQAIDVYVILFYGMLLYSFMFYSILKHYVVSFIHFHADNIYNYFLSVGK